MIHHLVSLLWYSTQWRIHHVVYLLEKKTILRKASGNFLSNWHLSCITNFIPDNSFRFVSVNNPRAAKDPKSSRLARSHAVRQGLKAKRKLQEKSNVNFRVGIPTKNIQESRSIGLASLSPSTHDPFDMLVVDSWRLKSLLSYCKYLSKVYIVSPRAYTEWHRHS